MKNSGDRHVLFLDVVGYSKLLIDEQSEALQELDQIVRNTEAVKKGEAASQLNRLPAGDGMASFLLKPFRNDPKSSIPKEAILKKTQKVKDLKRAILAEQAKIRKAPRRRRNPS